MTIFFREIKLVCSLFLSIFVTFVAGNISYDVVEASMDVSITEQITTEINWRTGADSDIIAIGISRPDNRGMALSREAAIMAAQRNLIGIVKGMSIDSETTMRDLIIESDVVNRKITGTLRGAQIVEEKSMPDGGYYVKMRVPIYGVSDSIASAILPSLVSDTPKPFEKPIMPVRREAVEAQSAGYTGVIIDASGLGLEPTFSPVIYDTNGRAIYGIENLQYDAIITEGMVGYSRSVSEGSERAGANPLVVKAVQVRGGGNSTNQVNAVISVEDADKILMANESSRMLDCCAVVFVR